MQMFVDFINDCSGMPSFALSNVHPLMASISLKFPPERSCTYKYWGEHACSPYYLCIHLWAWLRNESFRHALVSCSKHGHAPQDFAKQAFSTPLWLKEFLFLQVRVFNNIFLLSHCNAVRFVCRLSLSIHIHRIYIRRLLFLVSR